MAFSVEIDSDSGFCGGVIRAIESAEKYLDSPLHGRLYSLGPIVHNERELSRLEAKGLARIEREDLERMTAGSGAGDTLLIRAHGEPPETYEMAEKLSFEVKDCTCPVVLQLQRRIREAYDRVKPEGGRIIIFGKIGHAEVLGLVGQVKGDALVIEDLAMLENAVNSGLIDFNAPLEVFSQTTKNPDEYGRICGLLKQHTARIIVHDTICNQVRTRHSKLAGFASCHDVIIFVAGRLSSNGDALCKLCQSVNPRTYKVESADDLDSDWFRPDDRVGICGATSTPKWLLEEVADATEKFCKIDDK